MKRISGTTLAQSMLESYAGASRENELMLAGEGLADPAAFLILRALSGSNGKVEIGGRRFAFSCIPTFRLEDAESGQVHECRGSGSLLERILLLQRDADSLDVPAAGADLG